MRILQSMASGLCLAICGTAFAQITDAPVENGSQPIGDPGYAASFHCPGSYPDLASRREATVAFLNWARKAHPEWRVEETLNYRSALLEANQCDRTLDDMVTNDTHLPTD